MQPAIGLVRRRPGAGLLDPFNVAGYLAWAAVAFHPLQHQVAGTPWPAPHPDLAVAGMVAMLLLFLARAQLDAMSASVAARRAVLGGQLLASLVACWASRDDLAPVLLVVVAAQLATVFPVRQLVLLLLAANAALLAVPFHTDSVAVLVFAYASFQLYAAFGASFALRIYEAREAALRMNAELVATRHLLEEGTRADERLRLSRELHDLAGHKLTALKMQLALRRRQAAPADAPGLEHCERLADELLADIRGIVTVLRPHEGVDLQQALRALDPALPQPRISFDLDPAVRVADMRSAEVLLRCAQEGLTNALRHSAATRVRVTLARGDDGLRLAVSDDGVGGAAGLRAGNGLRGLRERLADLGGRLEIEDGRPAGLLLRAVLPEAPA